MCDKSLEHMTLFIVHYVCDARSVNTAGFEKIYITKHKKY